MCRKCGGSAVGWLFEHHHLVCLTFWILKQVLVESSLIKHIYPCTREGCCAVFQCLGPFSYPSLLILPISAIILSCLWTFHSGEKALLKLWQKSYRTEVKCFGHKTAFLINTGPTAAHSRPIYLPVACYRRIFHRSSVLPGIVFTGIATLTSGRAERTQTDPILLIEVAFVRPSLPTVERGKLS